MAELGQFVSLVQLGEIGLLAAVLYGIWRYMVAQQKKRAEAEQAREEARAVRDRTEQARREKLDEWLRSLVEADRAEREATVKGLQELTRASVRVQEQILAELTAMRDAVEKHGQRSEQIWGVVQNLGG